MLKEDFPHKYSYDGLGQLIKERNHSYTYDSYYNRLSKDHQHYEVNTLHALLTAGSTSFTYDPSGNPLTKTTSSSQTHYKYDALDRLIEVTEGHNRTTFTYDSFHRRMTKTTHLYQSNIWTRQAHYKYLYDGQREIGAYSKDNLLELRILGHGERDALLLRLNGKIYFPLQDLQGNMVRVMSMDRSQIFSYDYNAFSEESPVQDINPWRYASKRYDSETSLVYFGHRYYNPDTARWLTPDPSTFTDSANLYAYTYNNPFLYVDAYGLLSWPTVPPQEFNNPFIKPPPKNIDQIGYFPFEDYMQMKYDQMFDRTLPIKYEPPPPPLERSRAFDIPGKELDNKMIMTVNGMNTDYAQARENSFYIREYTEGAKIHGVHAATFGSINDVSRYRLGLNNIATDPVTHIQKTWDNYFQKAGPDATILVIAHSGGNIDTRLALFLFDRELRKRIFVLGIAPGGYIDPETCGGVRHYRSGNDRVPRLDTYGARKFASTIYTLTPHPNADKFDHGFMSPTYRKPLADNISDYLKFGKLF